MPEVGRQILVRLVQGGHFLHTFSGEIRRNYPNIRRHFPFPSPSPSLNKLPEITLARPSGAVTAIEAGPSTGLILFQRASSSSLGRRAAMLAKFLVPSLNK